MTDVVHLPAWLLLDGSALVFTGQDGVQLSIPVLARESLLTHTSVFIVAAADKLMAHDYPVRWRDLPEDKALARLLSKPIPAGAQELEAIYFRLIHAPRLPVPLPGGPA